MKKMTFGRLPFSRKGGARLYATSEMSHEVTRIVSDGKGVWQHQVRWDVPGKASRIVKSRRSSGGGSRRQGFGEVVWNWGAKYKSARRESRNTSSAADKVVRDRNAALSSLPVGYRSVSP